MISSRSVDLITYDGNRDEGVLIAVEDRPWEATPARFAEMVAKIDYYLSVIQSGQLSARYPKLAGRPCSVQLDFIHAPGPELTDFLNSMAETMSATGIALTVNALANP